jgi:hypothetical protein
MPVIRLSEAQRRYPERDFAECRDPHHEAEKSKRAVAVAIVGDDVYPVCNACLQRVLVNWAD